MAVAETVVDLLDAFHGSNLARLAVPFVLFSAVLLIARGPRGLRLSDETLRSVTVTLVILLVNGYLATWLVLRVDLAVPGYAIVGLPHLDAGAWQRLPWPVTLLLVVLLIDLADYATHRLMHNSLLWGVHAVHHSEQRMTWMTSSRVHIFESTIMRLGYLVLIGFVGFPLWALLGANAVTVLHNRYVHCDVGWNHGPLAKVIASPNWHRWHHSVAPEDHNKNYANVFSFLDVIFGTYHNPGRCNRPVGLDDLPNPGVVNQLAYPFTYLWRQFVADQRRWRSSSAQAVSPTPAVDADR